MLYSTVPAFRSYHGCVSGEAGLRSNTTPVARQVSVVSWAAPEVRCEPANVPAYDCGGTFRHSSWKKLAVSCCMSSENEPVPPTRCTLATIRPVLRSTRFKLTLSVPPDAVPEPVTR